MKKVFIIHGWTYDLKRWTNICELLQNAGIEPVMLRVPGLTEPSDQAWDINGYVGWLDKKLNDVEQPILVGHSNGGRIALSYIQTHPSKLSKLILIDSAGVAHNETKAAAKLKTLKFISKAGKPLAKLPGVKKAFYKVVGAQDYLNAPPNMKLTMRNMLAADQSIDFSKIKLPTTIIWGNDDTLTPLSDGRTIHKLIAGSDLIVIDGARHAPFFSHADEVAKIIEQVVN